MAVMDRRQYDELRRVSGGSGGVLKEGVVMASQLLADTEFEPAENDDGDGDESTLLGVSERVGKMTVGARRKVKAERNGKERKGVGLEMGLNRGVAGDGIVGPVEVGKNRFERMKGSGASGKSPTSGLRESVENHRNHRAVEEDDECIEPRPYRFENIRGKKKRQFDEREPPTPDKAVLKRGGVSPHVPVDSSNDLFHYSRASRKAGGFSGGQYKKWDQRSGMVTPSAAMDSGLDWNVERALDLDLDDDHALPPDSMSNFNVETQRRPARSTKPNLQLIVPDVDYVEEYDFIFANDGTFKDQGFQISRAGIQRTPGDLLCADEDAAYDDVPSSKRIAYVVNNLSELQLDSVLGKGASGKVMMGRHKPTNTPLAVKVVDISDGSKRDQLLKELSTLITHTNPFLVRFYEAFYNGAGAVHIVLEYMDCGSLKDVIERNGAVPELVVRQVALHCLRGLKFLHQSNVLHRDLKSANILLSATSQRAKLSDFGLAKKLGKSREANTFVGTPAYMSPERIDGLDYTYASDVWGLGITVAESLLGTHPFDPRGAYDAYLTRKAIILDSNKFSAEAVDFVRLCTAVNPAERPTTRTLLEHPWVTKPMLSCRKPFSEWLQKIKAERQQPVLRR